MNEGTSNPMDRWVCCGKPMNGNHALGCIYTRYGTGSTDAAPSTPDPRVTFGKERVDLTPPDPTPNGGGERVGDRVYRYDPVITGEGPDSDVEMVVALDGDWVLFEDYTATVARLEGERDTLRTALAAAERAGAERYQDEIVARIGSGDYTWPMNLSELNERLTIIRAALFPAPTTDTQPQPPTGAEGGRDG